MVTNQATCTMGIPTNWPETDENFLDLPNITAGLIIEVFVRWYNPYENFRVTLALKMHQKLC